MKRRYTSLEQLLELHEDRRRSVYTCPAGHPTVGIGHNLDAHPLAGIQRGCEISDAQVDAILRADIAFLRVELHRALPWYRLLDDVRACVLEDMCFNLGVAGLLEFKKTLALIKRGAYAAASVEMLRSRWSMQVGDRAERLSNMLRLGTWPEA